jgi:hypothetical protein
MVSLVALVWLRAGLPGVTVLGAVVLAGLVVLRVAWPHCFAGWCPARPATGGGGGSTGGTGRP